MSGDCSVLFIQKTSRDYLHYCDYVLGTGSSEVSFALFCDCFLKKMLHLRSFTACCFPLTLGSQSKKTSYVYRTGYILYPYF